MKAGLGEASVKIEQSKVLDALREEILVISNDASRDCRIVFANKALLKTLRVQSKLLRKATLGKFANIGNHFYAKLDELASGEVEEASVELELKGENFLITRVAKLSVIEARADLQAAFLLQLSLAGDVEGEGGGKFSKLDDDSLRKDRLENLAHTASGIAHDFNNRLTTLLAAISLAKMEVEDKMQESSDCGALGDYLKEAENSALSAKDICQKLLSFAKGSSKNAAVHDLRVVIEQALELCSFGSNVRVVKRLPLSELWVKIDPTLITQVFHNIILNGSQAMPSGGVLSIGAKKSSAHEVGLPTLDGRAYIAVSIRDRGKGIAPEILPKIFDAYFSTKKNGSGVGLHLANSIIQQHGGNISARSSLNHGSEFIICLPECEKLQAKFVTEHRAEMAQIGGKASQKSVASFMNEKILVVDDNPSILKVSRNMLERLGAEVTCVSDGRKAIEKVRQNQNRGIEFSAAIIDLTMPESEDGVSVAKEIRRVSPDTKLVASSGYFEASDRQEYIKHGFNEILPKPYDYQKLKDILGSLSEV